MAAVNDTQLDTLRRDWSTGVGPRLGVYALATASIVGGGLLMTTGIGIPLGGLLASVGGSALLGGGISLATQEMFTGHVNWAQVLSDMALGLGGGGLAYGVGRAVARSIALDAISPIARGAITGMIVEPPAGALIRFVHGGDPFDPGPLALSFVLGGLTGAMGANQGYGPPYVNKIPGDTEFGLEMAEGAGIRALAPRGYEFEKFIREGDGHVIWTVDVDGKLRALPRFLPVEGEAVQPPPYYRDTLTHDVTCEGRAVLDGGEAQLVWLSPGRFRGKWRSNETGHYLASPKTMGIGRDAWASYGITFEEERIAKRIWWGWKLL